MSVGKYTNKYGEIKNAWHRNRDGSYWTGWMPDNVLPLELYKHALSLLNDLFVEHPEFREEMLNLLIQNQLPKLKD